MGTSTAVQVLGESFFYLPFLTPGYEFIIGHSESRNRDSMCSKLPSISIQKFQGCMFLSCLHTVVDKGKKLYN